MIVFNGKEISSLSYSGHPTNERWYIDENRVPHLVWQSVRSCFGAGYWSNDKPWINEEAWKNE